MANFISRFITATDGLQLHVRDYAPVPDAAARLPVVCLPGLSRNSRDFHPFASRLCEDAASPRCVISIDYRGRGRSSRDPDPAHYNVGVECADVLAVCDALGIAQAIFVGTSRGGLILHVMAALQPDRIAAAVLNDIGPEIEAQGLRDIRDYLARRAVFDDTEAAADHLDAVHGPTFPALTRQDWLDMADAIYVEENGRLVSDHDPALVAPLLTMDFTQPLPTLWPQYALLAQKPLLVVRGEYSRLFSEKTSARMKAQGPNVETTIAKGQGHAPLLHHPDLFERVKGFLDGR